MKIYDISQEVFGCEVYPGDPKPVKEVLCSIENGEPCNLTAFYMCAHNGTHIDAPYHFFNNGKTVEQLPLTKTTGPAYVAEHNGTVTARAAYNIINTAEGLDTEAAKRILIKGRAVVSCEAAKVFAEAKLELIGNESQSVGPEDSPMAVHKILLGADIVLLEGIRLGHVPEGVYFLSAAPILLSGSDGAPCRDTLLKHE